MQEQSMLIYLIIKKHSIKANFLYITLYDRDINMQQMGPERTICIYTLAQTYHVKLQDLVADFQPQERTSISLLFHLHCHLRKILTF